MSSVSEQLSYRALGLTDDEVLARAEEIYLDRMKRYGAMTRPEDAAEYFRAKLAHLGHEEFHVVYLDNRHRILSSELHARGTLDGATIYCRQIAKRALLLDAAAVICSHNHPSGNPEPSAADRAITKRIVDALNLLDIRLVDHVVVGAEGTVSFAERGWV